MEDVVLMRVLPHLPLTQLFQCKTVSKSWNQILSSTWFLQGPWQEMHCHSKTDTWISRDWIVMQVRKGNRVRQLVAYDPIRDTWQPLGRPHERPVSGSAARKQLVSVSSAEAKFAAMKGLACVVFNHVSPASFNNRLSISGRRHHNINGADDLVILVLNPLTGSYKVLPPPENISSANRQYIPAVQIIDGCCSTPLYRVYLQPAADHDFPCEARVFDSATSRWASTVASKVTSNVSIDTFLHADFVRYVAQKGRLFGYHTASSTWFHTSVPLPPEALHSSLTSATNIHSHDNYSSCVQESFAITQSSGAVLLAAPVEIPQPAKSNNYATFSLIGFAVWNLEEDYSINNNPPRWIEVSRTPASHAFPIPYPANDTHTLLQHRIKLISSDNLICMSMIVSSYIHDSYPHLKADSFTPLVYDVASRDWQHLPPIPSGLADHDDHVIPGFFLQPAFANTAVGS